MGAQSDYSAGEAKFPSQPSDALSDKLVEVSPIRFDSTGHQSSGTGSSDLPALHGLVFEMANVLYDASLWRRWLFKLLTRFGVQSSYNSFSYGYLDVSVHRVGRLRLCIQRRPVQESRDQHSFDNSPKLFAVFHALQSLLTPRHPPCALNSLTT